MLAVRAGSHASYWTAVFPLAVLFGLGLASLMPPLTATAMNSAPDSLAGLASGVSNAVARVAGLLWIAAALATAFITGPHRSTRERPALMQTPIPHLTCPVAVGTARTGRSARRGVRLRRGCAPGQPGRQ